MVDGLDSGRYGDPGRVAEQEVPGLVDSRLFGIFTPASVEVAPIEGLDSGRFQDATAIAVSGSLDVEHTAQAAVGNVSVVEVSGVFRADMFAAPPGTDAGPPVEGFEQTSAAPRPRRPKSAAGGATELRIILCRSCGETHRLSRCPTCGTAHPDEP